MNYLPMIVFVISSLIFLIFEYYFKLIDNNYTFVHFIFGFLFPLITGYIPLYIFLNQENLKNIFSLNIDKINQVQPKWDIYSGLAITTFWSVGNEVFTDLENLNETIFENNNWHHLVSDFGGMLLITLLVYLVYRASNKPLERNI